MGRGAGGAAEKAARRMVEVHCGGTLSPRGRRRRGGRPPDGGAVDLRQGGHQIDELRAVRGALGERVSLDPDGPEALAGADHVQAGPRRRPEEVVRDVELLQARKSMDIMSKDL